MQPAEQQQYTPSLQHFCGGLLAGSSATVDSPTCCRITHIVQHDKAVIAHAEVSNMLLACGSAGPVMTAQLIMFGGWRLGCVTHWYREPVTSH
jgi:hypothetical protein